MSQPHAAFWLHTACFHASTTNPNRAKQQGEGGQGNHAIKDGKGASADGAGGGGWGEGGGGGGGGLGEDDDGEVSREAIGAFVSGLLTVLCSCVGQMLELTNREVRRSW